MGFFRIWTVPFSNSTGTLFKLERYSFELERYSFELEQPDLDSSSSSSKEDPKRRGLSKRNKTRSTAVRDL